MVERRDTRQKAFLSSELKKRNALFTAEDFYNLIHTHQPPIGIATVYRFLNDMKTQGILHTYTCDRRTLYSRKNLRHNHFTCEKCGTVTHLTIDKVDFLKKHIDGDICHFQIEVSGVCALCKQLS